MLNKNTKQLYIDAVAKWGISAQMQMAIEECSELIQAICKEWRNNNDNSLDNLHEEIADVDIMIEQLKSIFDIKKITYYKKQKLKKLKKLVYVENTTSN